MPVLREAAAAVAGRIVDVERTTDFESKAPNGARVTIATGDGFARIRYDLAQVAELRPDFGQYVALLVRYGVFAPDRGGAVATCALVRPLTDADVDGLMSAVAAPVAA